MKCFPLQVAIILGAGLATGLAFSMNSKVQLHLDPNINSKLPVRPAPTGPTGPTGVTGTTGQTGATTAAPKAAATDLFISLEAAKQLFDSHSAIFIDARPKKDFLEGHITGAMQLEKGELDGPPPAKVLNYLPGSAVIVYCHGQLCTDSENVVKRLVALNKGIGPFHIIKDGFPGWQSAKYPVESGPESGFE